MPREKASVIENVLLFKSVKFRMSVAAVILLKETGCLKRSRITLSNKNSVETPALSITWEPHPEKWQHPQRLFVKRVSLLSAYFFQCTYKRMRLITSKYGWQLPCNFFTKLIHINKKYYNLTDWREQSENIFPTC